jgi:cell wall-associated NlpC family hydrolase
MRKALSITLASLVLATTATLVAPTTASAWTTHHTNTTTTTNGLDFNDPADYPGYYSIHVKASQRSGKGLRGKAALYLDGDLQRVRLLKHGNILFRADRSDLRDNTSVTVTVRIFPLSKFYRDAVVRREVKDIPRGEFVLDRALDQRGDPYRYGADGPSAFDCSGLVQYAYRHSTGRRLPHSSSGIASAGSRVSSPRRGDVVYTPGHVSLWAGDGMVVEAAHPGTSVRYTHMWQRSPKYYRF